jgi:hypothetical protein
VKIIRIFRANEQRRTSESQVTETLEIEMSKLAIEN